MVRGMREESFSHSRVRRAKASAGISLAALYRYLPGHTAHFIGISSHRNASDPGLRHVGSSALVSQILDLQRKRASDIVFANEVLMASASIPNDTQSARIAMVEQHIRLETNITLKAFSTRSATVPGMTMKRGRTFSGWCWSALILRADHGGAA
jgi:hypothetical protein